MASLPGTLLLTLSLATIGLAFSTQVDSTDAAQEARAIAQREADFATLLTGSKLVGSFSMSGKPGPAIQEDSYSITRVSKAEGDKWLFEAKVEYGGRDIPIHLKLPVLWAGDTPMISVSDMGFPMLGQYSARVLFHGDQYAGVWHGKGYGGQMWGRVERDVTAVPKPKKKREDQRQAVNWPSFRGTGASGVSDGARVPTEWDVDEGTNILWHFPFPGMSHSSPVIWGERLFLTTAVRKQEDEQELRVGLYGDIAGVEDESEFSFELHCLDKITGDELWSRVCWTGKPPVKRHPKGSHAAPSPATDGERVLAFFGGEGLYCFDMHGKALWQKDLGPMDSGYYLVPDAQWGFCSSPILHDGLAIVQCDKQNGSFIAALDARTGEEIWKLVGGGDIPVPTPIVSKDLIFITNAHGPMAPIFAIDAKATGEISLKAADEPFLHWLKPRRGNYMQTPLAIGDSIYFCSDAGIMSSYDTTTGEEHYRERLGEGRTGFSASPVAANGNLYYTSEEGNVYVVQADPFEVLSVNPMGEECMATPAISAGVLYSRTRRHVLAVGFVE